MKDKVQSFLDGVLKGRIKPKIDSYEVVKDKVYIDYYGHKLKMFVYENGKLVDVKKIIF